MTQLLERMREELVRRNYSASTIRSYLRIVRDFQRYANKRLDRVCSDDLRRYHAYLLAERKLAVRTVVQHVAAIRFLYCKALKRHCGRSLPARSCDTCHMSPPCPEVPLLRVLVRVRALSVQDLLLLASEKDSGLRKEAEEALVSLAFEEPPAMDTLISEIRAGKDAGGLLDKLLQQAPDRLRGVRDRILTLLQSSSARVRKRVLRSFSSAWLDPEAARQLALNAIRDASPPVRSAAAEFLKRQARE